MAPSLYKQDTAHGKSARRSLYWDSAAAPPARRARGDVHTSAPSPRRRDVGELVGSIQVPHWVLLVAIGVACLLAGSVLGVRFLEVPESDSLTATTPTVEASPLPPRFQRGVNLTGYQADAYGSERAESMLEHLAGLGVTHVALVPMLYMADAEASAVTTDPERTATDASLLAIMEHARSLGISVILKPHVDVEDGTFRGEILPADPGAWFASYRGQIEHYADLAQQGGAQTLVVGTELTTMAGYDDNVRALIDAARARFGGWLTWAANQLDDAEAIRFWDALDLIGVDAYMPLASVDAQPDAADLRVAWGPLADRVAALAEHWDRPVVFTELGYQSRLGGAQAGGASLPESTPIDDKTQASAYEAAFEAMSQVSGFRGIWWWDYAADERDDAAGDFTPEGKAAEEVLRKWYGGD